MARFDVFRDHRTGAYLLDCQSDTLAGLNTRFVVPLMPPDEAPVAAERLNPMIAVHGESLRMVTQFAAAFPASQLRERVGAVPEQNIAITRALDFLIGTD